MYRTIFQSKRRRLVFKTGTTRQKNVFLSRETIKFFKSKKKILVLRNNLTKIQTFYTTYSSKCRESRNPEKKFELIKRLSSMFNSEILKSEASVSTIMSVKPLHVGKIKSTEKNISNS